MIDVEWIGHIIMFCLLCFLSVIIIATLFFEYRIAKFFRKLKDEFSKNFGDGFLVLFSVGVISMIYQIFTAIYSYYNLYRISEIYGSYAPTLIVEFLYSPYMILNTALDVATEIVFSIATLCAFYFLYSSTNYSSSKNFSENKNGMVKKFLKNIFKPLSKYKIFIITIVCSALIASVIIEIMKSQTFEIIRYMNVAHICIGCIISLMILLTKYYLKTFFGKSDDRFSKLLSKGFNILFIVGVCEIIYDAVKEGVEFYLSKILSTLSIEDFHFVVDVRAYAYFTIPLLFSLLTFYGIYVIYSSKRFFKEMVIK